jgi:hypothetical protein
MRPLLIDEVAKTKIAHVRSYAEENPYYPDTHEGPPPGDNPGYVCYLNTYRCAFTYTHTRLGVFRHLSISVPSKGYPNPVAILTIATEFGFTGWNGKTIVPFPWTSSVSKQEHCVVIAQEVEEV